MADIISTTLFEAEDVAVFRIPPGNLSLSKWDINDSNIIWRGNLRLIEEELIQDDKRVFLTGSNEAGVQSLSPFTLGSQLSLFHHRDTDDAHIKPFRGLRLKLELFNVDNCLVVPPNDFGLEDTATWAEVWYNPLLVEQDDTDIEPNHYFIANNRQETIQMTPQSSKFYKIIVQLPGSGYHPFLEEEQSAQDGLLLQVALGLKISENFAAISFSESLSLYRRRFKNFVDQYNYELRLSEIEDKQKHLSLIRDTGDQFQTDEPVDIEEDDHDEEDDFGDFVSG